MRTDGKGEVEHYVPQLLLRLHANNPGARKGSEQVWCFDKLTDKVFSPNIARVLAEKRFYEIEIDGNLFSLEESLQKVEDAASPILTRIVANRTVGNLTEAERQTISRFCAVQLVRTQGHRDHMRDVHEATLDALKRRGFDDDQLAKFAMPSEEEAKATALRMLADAPETYGPHFINKHWHLIESAEQDPFHLGDHPVVVDSNQSITGHRQSGLASPGVSIYLPLCSTLCLLMTDSLIISEIFRDAVKFESGHRSLIGAMARNELTPEIVAHYKEMKVARHKIREIVRHMRLGTPEAYDTQVTLRANALQMFYASRWIVSSTSDFSTPKRMIADSAEFRTRPKVRAE